MHSNGINQKRMQAGHDFCPHHDATFVKLFRFLRETNIAVMLYAAFDPTAWSRNTQSCCLHCTGLLKQPQGSSMVPVADCRVSSTPAVTVGSFREGEAAQRSG